MRWCICKSLAQRTITIVILIILYNAHTSIASWMEERLFLRARCKAKCLRLFQFTDDQTEFASVWPLIGTRHSILENCFDKQPEGCSSSCFTACDQPPDQCVLSCSSQGIGCHVGCTLLADSVQPRPGVCATDLGGDANAVQSAGVTPEDQNRMIDPVCVSSCHFDSSCTDPLHKCCSVGCSQVCIQPAFNMSTPPMPASLKPIVSKTSVMIMELDWSVPYDQLNPTHGPLVFILQTRICVCKHLDPSHLSTWQTLIMTHQFGAKLDAFEPGKMYQFRIAAVSPFGTRGFGPPSEPYPLIPVRPNPPSPPRNVTDSMWRFYSTGDIHVLLTWASPDQSDLPIMEYSIKWVIDHGFIQSGGQSLEGLTQFTHTIPSEHTQYIIQNLKQSTSYKVQLRAVSYWHGYGPLESQPNTIFLSTQALLPVLRVKDVATRRTDGVMQNDQLPPNATGCECRTEPSISRPLSLQKMFYDNNELVATFAYRPPVPGVSYVLEWAPQVCINPRESDTIYVRQTLKIQGRPRMLFLNNLQFSCRYVVRLRRWIQETSDRHSKEWSLVQSQRDRTSDEMQVVFDCFCTPSCGDVEVNRGPPPTNCSLPDPGAPSSPSNLRADQIGQLDYRISWESAQVADDEKQVRPPLWVTKYRVIWAPRVDEPVSKEMYNDEAGFRPIMDLQQSDARIVSKNQTWIDLHNLKDGTFYIVRVQTIALIDQRGQQRESSPATLYFVTPEITNLSVTIDHKAGPPIQSNYAGTTAVQLNVVHIIVGLFLSLTL